MPSNSAATPEALRAIVIVMDDETVNHSSTMIISFMPFHLPTAAAAADAIAMVHDVRRPLIALSFARFGER